MILCDVQFPTLPKSLLTSKNHRYEYRKNRIYRMDGKDHGTIRHPQRTSLIQPVQIHRDRRRGAA